MELMEAHFVSIRNDQTGEELEEKIRNHTAELGIIGLGYVGLPLAMDMAQSGFHVTGIDIDGRRVGLLNEGVSYVLDVSSETLRSAVGEGRIRATQSFAAVDALDTVSICVPTPLRKTKEPDLSYVIAAAEAVHNHLRPGQLIILESITYPGTTREIVLPILEKSGLRVGRDFYLAYSPEWGNLGNATYTIRNIPKVVGGITPRCTKLARLLYEKFTARVVPVSSSESAEMVKLLENTFRSVNIALANEIGRMCRKLGINAWEVIDAAKAKPFSFGSYYPDPGLGGHYIPVDSYYLSWKARMNGFEPQLIDMAAFINSRIPDFIVGRVAEGLNKSKKSLNGSRVLVVGVAQTRNVSDTRESPALEVLKGLLEKGATVFYTDPFVPKIEVTGEIFESVNLESHFLGSMDCVVILTAHSNLNYEMIAAESRLVLDCRDALHDFPRENITVL
jgi:UDP-N-acetyl-D-glucosamine dehydrogenase